MLLLPTEVLECENSFLKTYKKLTDDKDRKEALVQYYLTNGDLPKSILLEFYRQALKDEEISKDQPSGEFNTKIDNIYFKIHFCHLDDFYSNQKNLYLDVVSTFTDLSLMTPKGRFLKERVRDLEEYKNVFSEDLIQELYNSIEYAVKKGHI